MELRQIMLNKVAELFMRYGIKSVSMDDISRTLGISKKTLYQYVDNKADLLQQTFQQHIDEDIQTMERIVAESTDAIDELLNIAKYVTQSLRELSPNTLYDLQKYYQEVWQMIEGLHQKHIYSLILVNLERGIRESLYRDDLTPDIIARIYMGCNSIMVDEAIFPLRKYSMEQLYLEYMRYHIYGIASKKGLRLLEKYTKNK
ncbi:MAG: TetR/AcrR family transcriptional regulator [Bacteroidota bacterium]